MCKRASGDVTSVVQVNPTSIIFKHNALKWFSMLSSGSQLCSASCLIDLLHSRQVRPSFTLCLVITKEMLCIINNTRASTANRRLSTSLLLQTRSANVWGGVGVEWVFPAWVGVRCVASTYSLCCLSCCVLRVRQANWKIPQSDLSPKRFKCVFLITKVCLRSERHTHTVV